MTLRLLSSNTLHKCLGIRALLNRSSSCIHTSIMTNNNYCSTAQEKSSDEVTTDKANFHLRFNVENFSPDDLQIKVIGNILVIEGMHGEKEDEGGVIRRYFVRKYTIPECFDTEKVLSSLSTKGILEIQAPLKKCINEPVVERTIPIQKSH